jgi:hypothetical protein
MTDQPVETPRVVVEEPPKPEDVKKPEEEELEIMEVSCYPDFILSNCFRLIRTFRNWI